MRPRITLVCHGTTRGLRSARFGGEDPLDDRGLQGARRLAGRLGPFDRCWSSPALRASETAEALGLEAPTTDNRLRDCDYGRWQGLTFGQVMLTEPRALVSWIRDPSRSPHGGEAVSDVVGRVAAWLRDRSRDKGHTVAITHAAVIRAAILHVIGAPLPSFWHIDVVPLSVTDLRTDGRRWVFRALCPPPAQDTEE